MRQPTSRLAAHAWWKAALRGDHPPVHDGWPECGFYRMRKVKGGPFVPVSIKLHQEWDDEGELTEPERLVCLVAGEPVDPVKVWTHLQPISHEAFESLTAEAVGRDPMKKLNLMKNPRGPND
jgi:hypothetical protein